MLSILIWNYFNWDKKDWVNQIDCCWILFAKTDGNGFVLHQQMHLA